MEKKIEIIQTIGVPHSGSTLLAIIIGSKNSFFNVGELKNITRPSLPEELCSCGETVSKCSFWSKIFKEWELKRNTSFKDYRDLYLKYERVIGIPKVLKNLVFPSKSFKTYASDTEKLYSLIYQFSNNSVVVESSKMPERTIILSKFAKVKVLHLCRDFKGILDSAKRREIKNINKGIERNKEPRSTLRAILVWIYVNLKCEIVALFFDSKKIRYKTYIENLSDFYKLDERLSGINQSSVFNAEHMIAGNRLRLNKNIKVEKNKNTYPRLNKPNYIFASIVDRLFFFWS